MLWKMSLTFNFVLVCVTVVFATPAISDIDEKGLKSDTDDELTNSIDDSLDDRSKRSYETGGYQWGSPNQGGQPFNSPHSPPNNYYFGQGGGSEFPGGSTNPFQQSQFDRGQPNNGKNPLQEVMGRALESVIVQSVRQLLDMTPLGSGQGGDFMRSARNARSVENIHKIEDHKMEKPEKVNFIEKLGSTNEENSHSLEKRDTRSGEEVDGSVENPETIKQQILLQNIMKEVKRQKRMRQLAYQQNLMKNREKVENQKMIQNSEGNWQQNNMDEAKQLEYLSNYQKELMNLYREKQNKARIDRNGGDFGKIHESKQYSSRYSPPEQDREAIGEYSMDHQQDLSKYNGRRKNNAQQMRSPKNNSRSFQKKQGFEQQQGFIENNEEPQNFMMNKMGQSNSDWRQQSWDPNNQFVQQQGMRKDNSIRKWSDKSMMQQNMNQQFRPESEVPIQEIQEGWRPQFPQNQQFFNPQPEFSQKNVLPQQIPSNEVPGKQRFQRISTNEICNDGFTPSGMPCSIDTTQKQMTDDGSFENYQKNQEMLLQPPTLIKRYVTYSNRFVPPPQAVMEPVTEQELFGGEGEPQRNFSSQELREMQRNQSNEETMNGWMGQ